MRLPWGIFWSVLVALALVLAACGGGDDDKTADGGDDQPAATQEDGGDEDGGEGDSTPEADDDGGDDGGSGGEIEAVDACALVTKEDAEAALGKSVGDGEPEAVSPVFSCTYKTEDFDSVSVSVLVYPDAETAQDGFQMAIDINDYPELDGIGDRAYDGRPIFDVTALEDQYEVSVDVSSSAEGDADFEAAKDLAQTAVDRLP